MPAAERTLALLDELAAATREARFDRLPALVSALEASLARAAGSGSGTGRPAQIRRRIEENRRLIAAANEGIVAARRRIGEVTASLTTLNTYDSLGRRTAFTPGREGFERKA